MTGALVALGVPIAGAANWTLLQYLNQREGKLPAVAATTTVGGQAPTAVLPQVAAHQPDMLLAVLLGAVLSAAITLPLAWPLTASTHDLQLLGLLGVFQLAIPCLLVVQLAKVLPAPEISLIGLLEVVFGVLLAWWGAGEVPGPTALQGGALVVGALLVNEWLALRSRQASSPGSAGRLLAPNEPT
jgi:drug/metabolite transporter (DMT)-like permease